MVFPHQLAPLLKLRLAVLLGLLLCAGAARCQDSAGEGTLLRGDHAEISITVRDSSGTIITAPGTVKLLRSGMPTGQSATSQGRAFFVAPALGEYTLIVQSAGYKTAQKDVSVLAAVKMETDVYLERDSSTSVSAVVPGTPVLAPKAKELFDKGVQALREDRLDEAEKYIGETLKLAPAHPDVLYMEGMLCIRKRNWTNAQTVLEKATQLDPNHPAALAALGMALTNQGKYDAAIPRLEKSLELNASAGYEARWALGKAYYYTGQYDRALKMSQEALVESSGKSPDIELLVAQALTAVGRYEESAEALRDFIKSHGADPQGATAKRWLARLAADGKIRSQ